MAVDETSIKKEIQQILNNGANPVHFTWSATIYANGKEILVQKIPSVDITRRYDTNFSDEVMVRAKIPLGTYLKQIFPYKENLMMTLHKKPAGESGGVSAQAASDIQNHKLRATIVDPTDHKIAGNTPAVQNQADSDITNMHDVDFQLVDLALEQIRMQSVGSVIRKTTPGDAVKFFMTAISQNVKVDGVNTIKGVDMVSPDNTQVRDHIILNHGLQFADVPGWIHQHMGGVYNAGFGFFLQGGIWYVYPLYNTKRWNTTPKNLTLINMPKNQMPGSDRTYRKTNNQVIVLLTGENRHHDDSDHQQLNLGNGLRFTDASKIMEGFGSAAANKYTINRSANNTEFVATTRSTGLNNVRMSERRITSNNYYELGKMARRMGQHMLVTWENSEPGLLYPGMPVKYIYFADNAVKEIYGTLIGCHHFTGQTQKGLLGGNYVQNSALTLFLDNGSSPAQTTPNTSITPT